MLLQRLITALVLAPLAILLILLPPTWLFALITGLVFLAAEREWTRLAGLSRGPASWLPILATAIAMALIWHFRAQAWLWPAVVALGVLWWLVSLGWLRHYTFAASPTPEHRRIKLGVSLMALVPCWTALAMLHRHVPSGHAWTLLALCIVWAADIGAYTAGRLFGKHKLAPHISPGKTRAGAWGGLIGGLLVAVAGGLLLGLRGPILVGVGLLGVVTVAAAIVGDLVESLLKRHAGIKDSGTIFPGHGGLLDRLDSVFAAIPVFALGWWLLAT